MNAPIRENYLRRFLLEVISATPGRAALIVVLLAGSSLFEGIALTMLFPLLAALGFSGDGELHDIATRINAIAAEWGVSLDIYSVSFLFIAMVALQHILFLVQAWLASGLQSEFTSRWRQQLIDAFLRCEWLHFTRSNAGELAHVLNSETYRAAFLINFGFQVVSLSLTAAVYFIVACVASLKVTLVLMIGGAGVIALSQLIVRHPTRVSSRQSDLYGRYSGRASEVLAGMKLVRAAGGDEAVRRSVWPIIEELRKVERWIFMYPSVLRSCFELSAVVALMTALVFATNVLGSDGITVLLIGGLFMRLYPRISTIQQFVHQFRMHIPFYASVVDTLDAAQAAEELNSSTRHDHVDVQPAGPPSVVLENLSVSYGERPALRGITLTIKARHTVAIVGPSGSGKSTLVDALLRLVPIGSGRIVVDGTDLECVDLTAWRRSVGYVPQDTFLFNATIRENIGFAQPHATMDEIREAAQKAQLTEFIAGLPLGYDTVVGDRGVMLSGGQRQRVGLARALLGGKRLLILDEATSALDSGTELAIMEDIVTLHGQITIIIIAHRLSTVRSADEIFVLDEGRLAEAGSWETLVARQGMFGKLWTTQTEVPQPVAALKR